MRGLGLAVRDRRLLGGCGDYLCGPCGDIIFRGPYVAVDWIINPLFFSGKRCILKFKSFFTTALKKNDHNFNTLFNQKIIYIYFFNLLVIKIFVCAEFDLESLTY